MSAARRCAWAFFLLGWTAVMTIPSAVDVDGWGHVLLGAGAAVTVALGVFLFCTGKAMPRVRDWLHKREMAALRRQVAEVKAIAEHNTGKLDDVFDAIGDVLAAAGGDTPVDLQKTQPHLRAIRGEEAG